MAESNTTTLLASIAADALARSMFAQAEIEILLAMLSEHGITIDSDRYKAQRVERFVQLMSEARDGDPEFSKLFSEEKIQRALEAFGLR